MESDSLDLVACVGDESGRRAALAAERRCER